MTSPSTWFILKVLLLSGVLSITIKYAFVGWDITATNGLVLTVVLLPSVILGVALALRIRH
ncbi:MAG: hypothetical protein NZ772_11520 [Cyanobacteria bacterium]|nr:hypothetical protein [Cyanobacteriota bacterium]MDW8202074.1 hypothetical protein [Cyanobacteriota bacterium SKYGB_h_bin112]